MPFSVILFRGLGFVFSPALTAALKRRELLPRYIVRYRVVGGRAMTKSKNPALVELDALAAPLYHALGLTLTRWQFVETGMFILAHAIIGADYKYSSRAFFRFRNADAKLQFLNDLCEAHFPETVLKAEWKLLHNRLKDSIRFRNYLAHFEVSYVRDRKYLPPDDPPVILVAHHMDEKARDKPLVRVVNLTELNTWGENYRALARALILFTKRHFSLEKLRATHLPPAWLHFLATDAI